MNLSRSASLRTDRLLGLARVQRSKSPAPRSELVIAVSSPPTVPDLKRILGLDGRSLARARLMKSTAVRCFGQCLGIAPADSAAATNIVYLPVQTRIFLSKRIPGQVRLW